MNFKINTMKILFVKSLFTLIMLTSYARLFANDTIVSHADSSAKINADRVHLFPEYYINGDIGVFLFHQNSTYKKNYLLETDLNFGLDFLSYKRFHTVWDINVLVGVGRQFENVVFDPRWLTIAIDPTIEFRFKSMIAQCGLDRRCFHEVDHTPARQTVYWTLPFMLLGSENMRLAAYEQSIFSSRELTLKKRLSWYVKPGWFVDKFFNYPADLTTGGHDYKFMFNSGTRYTFVKYGVWALWLNGVTNLYADRESEWYLTQEFELDNSFHGENFNITLFLNYVARDTKHSYKNMNRDQLGKIGLEFIF